MDLTVRQILSDDRIGETTERSGDFCGGTYVDDEFLKFIGSRVGESAMNLLKERYYGQVNYMVQQFCFKISLNSKLLNGILREIVRLLRNTLPGQKEINYRMKMIGPLNLILKL